MKTQRPGALPHTPLRGRKPLRIPFIVMVLMAVFWAAPLEAASPLASRDAELDSGDWAALVRRYPNPAVNNGEKNGEKDGPEGSAGLLACWWDTFGDETLTRLIRDALKNNRDLRVARERVAEARAALGISKAAKLPWLDSVDSWGRSQSPIDAGGSGKPAELWRLAADASWEIDIFGSRRQEIRAAAATLEARHAALHGAWVSLSSEIALNYLSLRTLQERLRIAEHNLSLQLESLAMVRSRYEAGLSDSLALNQAQYTADQTRSTIPPLQAGVGQTLNLLSVLVGDVPGSLGDELSRAMPLPDVKSAFTGIPADTLRQRPDIRAAERELVAQIARKKSAQVDLWPKFRLLGSIGTAASDSGGLFTSDSKLWSFGPQISLPLFHAGAIRKNIQVQTARQEQALAAYEQTVLKAVAEVRDALAANALEHRRNAALRSGVGAARNALAAASDKYRSGLSDYGNVIAAQHALLSLEEACAVSEGQKASNAVRLFKALGGGWAPLTDEENTEHPPQARKSRK